MLKCYTKYHILLIVFPGMWNPVWHVTNHPFGYPGEVFDLTGLFFVAPAEFPAEALVQ